MFCTVGVLTRNDAVFLPPSAADCQSLGWAQSGIPGVEYPHLATWDAGDWGGVYFLQLLSLNVSTGAGSQLKGWSLTS